MKMSTVAPILLLTIFWFVFQLSPVDAGGLAALTCAQIGAREGYKPGLDYGNWIGHDGYYTIGANNFEIKYGNAFDSGWSGYFSSPDRIFTDATKQKDTCPYEWSRGAYYNINLCPNDSVVELDMYTVRQGGRTLHGWLHIEVKLVDPDDEIEAIYVQVRDEHYNAVGEFVTNPAEQCKSTHPERYIQPTKYQILPCSAIGFREPKNSQALFMAKKTQLESSSKAFQHSDRFLPKYELKREIHFTWKYSEYWCNRHYMIRPDALILTKKNLQLYEKERKAKNQDDVYGEMRKVHHQLLRKTADYWLRMEWFGAADIVVESEGPPECDQHVIDEASGRKNFAKLSQSASTWIKHIVSSKYTNDFYHPKQQYPNPDAPGSFLIQSCQIPPYPRVKIPFGGRCTTFYEKTVEMSGIHGCNKDPNAIEFSDISPGIFQKYSEYRNLLFVKRQWYCNFSTTCKMPVDQREKEILLKFARGGAANSRTMALPSSGPKPLVVRNPKDDRKNDYRFQNALKYHGILSLFGTMFLTPMSIFSARYYKETAMKFQWCDIQIWYLIHIGCTVASLCMYLSSLTALLDHVDNWGRSKNPWGQTHDILGWISTTIFLYQTVFGGCRGGRDTAQRKPRFTCMTVHSVLGFLQYFINLILVMVSSKIPASPSINECGIDGMPKGLPALFYIVVAWFVLDFCFHVTLTILQYVWDREKNKKREWYCPMIPIVANASQEDIFGSMIRQIVFIAYTVTCFSFSITAMCLLGTSPRPPNNCQFGEMTCDLKEFPFGCTEYGKVYAALLKNGKIVVLP